MKMLALIGSLFLFSCSSNKNSPVLVQSDLNSEDINRVISKHSRDYTKCYQAQSSRLKTRGARVDLLWWVQQNGRVRSVQTEKHSKGARGLSECLSSVIKELRFASHSNASLIKVRYPFVFEARKTKEFY